MVFLQSDRQALSHFKCISHQNGSFPQATLLSQPRFLQVVKGLPHLSPGLLPPYTTDAAEDSQLFFLVGPQLGMKV